MDDTNAAIQMMLAQQTTIQTDVSAMRNDLTRAVTRLEVIDGWRTVADDKVNDHESRLRLLERFRYTIAGVAIIGGLGSGFIGYLIAHAVH